MKKRADRGEAAVQACPCGGGMPYAQCCGVFHHGGIAPDALRLMRARYSAYALQDERFILASWHPTTRPAASQEGVGAGTAAGNVAGITADRTRWLGLEVRNHLASGDAATVEFVARYKQSGRADRLHEISRFVREHGCWYYLDGSFPKAEQQ